MVASSGGNLEGKPGHGMTLNIGEVRGIGCGGNEWFIWWAAPRRFGGQCFNELAKIGRTTNNDSSNERSFGMGSRRDHKL